MFTISGRVLDVERITGGEGDQSYAYYRVAVLAGKADIARVKLDPKRYDGPVPSEGDDVALRVAVSAFTNRQGGASLSIVATEPALAA
jgi:hypothetical protein